MNFGEYAPPGKNCPILAHRSSRSNDKRRMAASERRSSELVKPGVASVELIAMVHSPDLLRPEPDC